MNKLFKLIALSGLLVAGQSFAKQPKIDINKEAQEINTDLLNIQTLFINGAKDINSGANANGVSDEVIKVLGKHIKRDGIAHSQNPYNTERIFVTRRLVLHKRNGEDFFSKVVVGLGERHFESDLAKEQADTIIQVRNGNHFKLGDYIACDVETFEKSPHLSCEFDSYISNMVRKKK